MWMRQCSRLCRLSSSKVPSTCQAGAGWAARAARRSPAHSPAPRATSTSRTGTRWALALYLQFICNIYTTSTQVTSDTDDDDTELVRHKHNFVALEQDTAATPQVTLPLVLTIVTRCHYDVMTPGDHVARHGGRHHPRLQLHRQHQNQEEQRQVLSHCADTCYFVSIIIVYFIWYRIRNFWR